MFRWFLPIFALSAVVRGAAAAPDPAGEEFFETKVRPVFVEHCYQCHSATAKKIKGDFRLDIPEGIKNGGESGEPSVVPGKPNDSLLIEAVRYELDDLQMPPKKKLSPVDIAALEAWVKMGAPYPVSATPATAPANGHPLHMSLAEGRHFWSFELPKEPVIPTVKPQGVWPRTEIDRFVLAKLQEKGLSPAPEADRRTLIRRATYDLTGLPPSADEVDAFVKDPDANAYEKLIDRLLASPRYGERWGRHWLDVARYADTKGYVFEEERRYPFSYTYRDWVIRAFNSDMPYDQFLMQQIAADQLSSASPNPNLAAMGFLTVGRRFINSQPDIIDDRIDVVCRGTMGLTVGCARCHDHKYDPIPTADYYSLYGVFASSREPAELPLLGTAAGDPKQAAAFEKKYGQLEQDVENFRVKRWREVVAELRKPETLAAYFVAAHELGPGGDWPKALGVAKTRNLNAWMLMRWRDYLRAAGKKHDPVWAVWGELPATAPTTRPVNRLVAEAFAQSPAGDVDAVAKGYGKLLAKYDGESPWKDGEEEALRLALRGEGTPTNFAVGDVEKFYNGQDGNDLRALKQKVDALVATDPGSPPRAMAMEDLPQPVTQHVFKRGNPGMVGEEVPRRFLAILSPGDRKPFTEGSGRLELARDIASKGNPLTARVMVNRVWAWHFGQGLVRTPSDFGTRGERPTHPELLDYLALQFENNDKWSLKKLHKTIMMSAVYRQASYGGDPKALMSDPENRLLSHFNIQRLDFESLRDSLLAAGGQLDLSMGGKSVDILSEPFSRRRTVYAFVDRQNLPGLFRTFDFASPDMHQAQRPETSVPQQALFMMNSPFVIQEARAAADAATVKGESDERKRIGLLYRAVLGREPAGDEVEMASRFVEGEEKQPAEQEKQEVSPWTYGYGEVDAASGKVKAFAALPHFTGTAWQGGAGLPDGRLGWAMLNAGGGHVGNDGAHAVIRRFTAPRDCVVSLTGTLSHRQMQGDGVRGRVVWSREGTLAEWRVHDREASTTISPLKLVKGETVDFVVDCGAAGDYGYDSFGWRVKLAIVEKGNAAAGAGPGGWDSVEGFTKGEKTRTPLNGWEKLAQVLMESNEFFFVD